MRVTQETKRFNPKPFFRLDEWAINALEWLQEDFADWGVRPSIFAFKTFPIPPACQKGEENDKIAEVEH